MNTTQRRIHRAAMRLFAERGVTQVNVKELAQAAGVARGTIYNNLADPEVLFEEVAAQLASDMNRRITQSFKGINDPAIRLANGVRLYVKRAHDEPYWGRFISRFAFSNPTLHHLLDGQPIRDILNGMLTGRYSFREEQIPSVVMMIGGSCIGAIFLVLEGHQTWREAGSDTAELLLLALGIAPVEARTIATGNLPELPEMD